MDPPRHSVHTLAFRSLKRTHDIFLSDQGALPPLDADIERFKMNIRARDAYGTVLHAVNPNDLKKRQMDVGEGSSSVDIGDNVYQASSSMSIVPAKQNNAVQVATPTNPVKKPLQMMKPKWHAPWKLYRVISGHLGWVYSCAVEPGNQFFATGAGDRVIKVWDLATGQLKVSLTGHISSVRGLAFSQRHPYLFSCGEDKQIKCWDLEYNKVIRHYHGHLSAIYTMALHPTIDILVTGGRDSTARVWDMRSKANVHILTGHTHTVASVVCQVFDPQIITGSHDTTIRLWDLAAGKSVATLTNHKKSVRALALHPTVSMFCSASPDNLKQWRCEDGKFVQTLNGHNAIINCLAANEDGVLVSGGDNGSIHFWDWRTGYNFQKLQSAVQPGSMDSEAGIFSATFDMSGTRLITTEGDKTVKMYKEDDTASEESYPINWRPEILKRKKY